DGGLTFSDRRISTAPFTPFSAMFFGDYTYIAAEGDIIRPIWGKTDGPFQSIWTALVDTSSLFAQPTQVGSVKLEAEQTWPNPFYETAFMAFKLRDEALVRLEVVDVYGRTVSVLIDGQKMQRGKYVYQFNPGKQSLPEGMYFFHLACDNEVKTRK